MRRGWLRPKQKCFQFTLETHEVYVLSYRCGSKLFHAHWPVNGIPVVASVYWIALSCPLMNNVHFCSINQAIGCKYRLQNYFSSVGRGMWYSETIKFYSLNYRWILYIPRCTVYVNGNGYVDMWILAMYHLLWRLYRNRYTYRQSSSIFVNTLDKYYLILLSILHFCSFDRLSPSALRCFTLRWNGVGMLAVQFRSSRRVPQANKKLRRRRRTAWYQSGRCTGQSPEAPEWPLWVQWWPRESSKPSTLVTSKTYQLLSG